MFWYEDFWIITLIILLVIILLIVYILGKSKHLIGHLDDMLNHLKR